MDGQRRERLILILLGCHRMDPGRSWKSNTPKRRENSWSRQRSRVLLRMADRGTRYQSHSHKREFDPDYERRMWKHHQHTRNRCNTCSVNSTAPEMSCCKCWGWTHEVCPSMCSEILISLWCLNKFSIRGKKIHDKSFPWNNGASKAGSKDTDHFQSSLLLVFVESWQIMVTWCFVVSLYDIKNSREYWGTYKCDIDS